MKITNSIFEDLHFKELFKKSSITLFLRLSGLIFNYFFIFMISRFYGAKTLGIFALTVMMLQIFTIIGKMGTDKALMKFVSHFNAKNSFKSILKISQRAFKIILPWSLLLSIFLYFFSEKIALLIFHDSSLTKYFKIVSFVLLGNVLLSQNSEKLRGLKKIRIYSFITFSLIPLLALIILCFLLLFGKKPYFPVLAYTISIFLNFLFSLFSWRKAKNELKTNEINKNPISLDSTSSYRSLFSLSIPMMLTSSLILLMGWTDTFMLGIFSTISDVGVYRVPLRLAAISSTMLLAVNSILGPKISEFWGKNDLNGLRKIIKQSTLLIFWLSLPIHIFLCIFPSQILKIFGGEFKSGVTALLILIVGQFVNSIVGSVGLILLMTGKQIVLQNIIITGTILNIILNYLLIPLFGINGAAIASMISLLIINIIPFFIVKKHLGFYTISKKMFFLK